RHGQQSGGRHGIGHAAFGPRGDDQPRGLGDAGAGSVNACDAQDSTMKIVLKLIAFVVVMLSISACSEEQAEVAVPQPVALSEEAVGHYCNMTVLEHTGPKAQIFLANNPHPIWFSQVRDAIAYIRSPEELSEAVVVYVNDMGKAKNWDFPEEDTWI